MKQLTTFMLLTFCFSFLFAQDVGKVLPNWSEGYLDIHHLNTGKGECIFFILPDGTTFLLDAGATNRSKPRVTDARPDSSRSPGEWIVRYIDHMLSHPSQKSIDIVMLSHFHGDHMGDISEVSRTSLNGKYKLSGITEVGDYFIFKKLIDRGWPTYDYPEPLNSKMMNNYRDFILFHQNTNGLKVERFLPGHSDQIRLVHHPDKYKNFEIRNIASNGEIWTGVGKNTRLHFPPLEDIPSIDKPSENMCSIAIRMSLGRFDYFTGGDLVGVVDEGAPLWHDVETPVAKALGPIDVNELNHHGYLDSENAFFLQTLRPRVHLIQVWSPSHPSPRTLSRLLSGRLYSGPRDIFATNMMSANEVVIGDKLAKLKSDQGHIVVRVDPDGVSYRIFILDDSSESFRILAVHGPYLSQ